MKDEQHINSYLEDYRAGFSEGVPACCDRAFAWTAAQAKRFDE